MGKMNFIPHQKSTKALQQVLHASMEVKMRHFFTHWNGMMAILLLFILITNPKRAWDIALEQCGIFRCGQVIFRNFNSSFWYAKLISRNFYKRIAIRNHPNKYFQFLLSALFNLKKTLFPVHNCGLAARAMAKASAWAGTDLLILNLSSLSRPSGRIKLPGLETWGQSDQCWVNKNLYSTCEFSWSAKKSCSITQVNVYWRFSWFGRSASKPVFLLSNLYSS